MRKGRYHFLYLPVGNYQLKAEQTGFRALERQLTLTVGQTLDVPFKLSVGAVAEQVNISSETLVLETVRTQAAETRAAARDRGICRSTGATTSTSPRSRPPRRDARQSGRQSTLRRNFRRQINVAGQRNINNGFVIDGLSANDDAADLPGTFFSQEVIREFQVIISGGIAEFGRASGGIVNVVTNSRQQRLARADVRLPAQPTLRRAHPLATTKDPLTQAQYGASIGGPLKRDPHVPLRQLRADALA